MDAFNQEFGNQFIGSATTLINADTLLGLKAKEPEEFIKGRDIKIYEKAKEEHTYITFVDVSKGRGQDYSTFSIIDITARPFKQVATFRNNIISPILFPDIIVWASKKYNDAIIVVENNDAGQVVCNGIYYDLEYENTFVESTVKANGIGVTMTKKIKRIGCSNLKDLMEQNVLEVVDADSIQELSSFVPKGNSYEADKGCHDDMVMNLVLFAWFVSTDAFGNIDEIDLKKMLYADRESLDDDLLDFGYISSASQDNLDDYRKMAQDLQDWNNL